MRRIYLVPVAATALVLTACGDNDAAEGEAMTQAELEDATQDVVMSRPGQYTSTAEMIEFSLPGLGEDMTATIRNQMQQAAATESSFCLTEQDAAKGREEMLRNLSESNCDITKFDASGGNIDAAMQCNDPNGMNGTVAVSGTIGEEASDIVMDFDQVVPGMDPAKIKMRVRSQRTGDCT